MTFGNIQTMFDLPPSRAGRFNQDGGRLPTMHDPIAGRVVALLTTRIAVIVHLPKVWKSEVYWDF